jgi:predicted amidohydrolase YtcJ
MKIFYNGNIYTPGSPRATAFAVDHGHFIALGSDVDILNLDLFVEEKTDLRGKTVLPGLTDAHVHLKLLADSMAMVDCETTTLEECLNRVKSKSDQQPENIWVRGHGWNQNRWQGGYSTAKILDSVTGAHPAYLTAKSLHAAWANSQALELAGINSQTPDPPGGIIQRDQKGNPTGILFEAGAMSLVESVIPRATQEEITVNIESLLPKLWELGLIGLHDFDSFDCWQALQGIYQAHELDLRIRKNIPFDHLENFIQAGLRTDYGDDWLHIGSLKLFADGALGPQTASMKNPYVGSENLGKLLLSEEEILSIGKKAVNHGIALAIHAIGDRANEVVLNAFHRLREYESANHLPHLLHRIEHVQIIDEEDVSRMRMLDIVASVQPVHAPSDMEMADKYLGSRAKNAYAYRSMIHNSVKFVFGSDAPVEPVNPFYGLHAAVTRRRLDGTPDYNGWHPEQKISLKQALNGFSHNPAIISSRGGHLGKIGLGYKADFLILDNDPFMIDPHAIGNLKPSATFIEGNCVYKHSALDLNL